ncbi:hypothetical protein AB4K20DRAFT_1865289 [Rhizopus microsporus]
MTPYSHTCRKKTRRDERSTIEATLEYHFMRKIEYEFYPEITSILECYTYPPTSVTEGCLTTIFPFLQSLEMTGDNQPGGDEEHNRKSTGQSCKEKAENNYYLSVIKLV